MTPASKGAAAAAGIVGRDDHTFAVKCMCPAPARWPSTTMTGANAGFSMARSRSFAPSLSRRSFLAETSMGRVVPLSIILIICLFIRRAPARQRRTTGTPTTNQAIRGAARKCPYSQEWTNFRDAGRITPSSVEFEACGLEQSDQEAGGHSRVIYVGGKSVTKGTSPPA